MEITARLLLAPAAAFALFSAVPPASAQDWTSAVRSGGAGTEEGRAVAVDAAGNRYVAGNFAGSASFGAAGTLTSVGNRDIFLATEGLPTTAPTVTTPTSANLTHNSGTLGGTVTTDGGAAITERGVSLFLDGDG